MQSEGGRRSPETHDTRSANGPKPAYQVGAAGQLEVLMLSQWVAAFDN
jgi:hypothetical protein